MGFLKSVGVIFFLLTLLGCDLAVNSNSSGQDTKTITHFCTEIEKGDLNKIITRLLKQPQNNSVTVNNITVGYEFNGPKTQVGLFYQHFLFEVDNLKE